MQPPILKRSDEQCEQGLGGNACGAALLDYNWQRRSACAISSLQKRVPLARKARLGPQRNGIDAFSPLAGAADDKDTLEK